jgi:hypothetical protein
MVMKGRPKHELPRARKLGCRLQIAILGTPLSPFPPVLLAQASTTVGGAPSGAVPWVGVELARGGLSAPFPRLFLNPPAHSKVR